MPSTHSNKQYNMYRTIFDKSVTCGTSVIRTKNLPLPLHTSVFTWQQSSLLLKCCMCVFCSVTMEDVLLHISDVSQAINHILYKIYKHL